jgi:hypothetical protein
MPPNTAEAADAFNSVRREKLIWFSPWSVLMNGIIRTRQRRVINPLDGLLPAFSANTKPRRRAFGGGIPCKAVRCKRAEAGGLNCRRMMAAPARRHHRIRRDVAPVPDPAPSGCAAGQNKNIENNPMQSKAGHGSPRGRFRCVSRDS